MSLAAWLLYLAAVAVLIVTPGPTMLMCITHAVNHGPARAMASVAGAITASFGAMMLSALGLGALLAASEAAFTTLKLAGAAYLIWLGIRTFLSAAPLDTGVGSRRGRHSFFVQGLLVGASNPKALLFFGAFFPQFIDPSRPLAAQFLALALTFAVGDALVMTACAFGVGRIAPRLREARLVRWINRTCGALFALLGGLLVFARRNA